MTFHAACGLVYLLDEDETANGAVLLAVGSYHDRWDSYLPEGHVPRSTSLAFESSPLEKAS